MPIAVGDGRVTAISQESIGMHPNPRGREIERCSQKEVSATATVVVLVHLNDIDQLPNSRYQSQRKEAQDGREGSRRLTQLQHMKMMKKD